LLTGFILSVLFNEFAPQLFGNETFLYTAYHTIHNGKDVFVIPFHICMGLSFMFTMIVMVSVSMAGPKINPKAFELDKEMFKLKPSTLALLVLMLMLIFALYVKFW
jgi:SSS family solute:Na+ symporter